MRYVVCHKGAYNLLCFTYLIMLNCVLIQILAFYIIWFAFFTGIFITL
jgi:hypothetical protein